MKIYTMSMRRNFSVLASTNAEAKAKARYALVADLQSGWVEPSDFEIIQVSENFEPLEDSNE